MPFEDLYASLATDREALDRLGHEPLPDEPDEVVYRLGHSSIPVAGMPDEVSVGRVKIFRVVGPVFTQITQLRQRHGLPVIFDKSMELRVPVGENEVLTICQIRDNPPAHAATAVSEWREEARSALGILSAALDERVAIEERFEDIINLRGGKPISSGDVRIRLRNFLPFDVTDEEKAVLNDLASLKTAALVPLTEAARWYLQAAQEGPTAEAIVYLWIAIEALTPRPKTSPKTVEAMLVSAGFLPEWLGELTLGRLAGLRADIVHKGLRDHPLIHDGYYRLETVVRVLLRNASGIRTSWSPVLTVAVFGERAEEIREMQASRQTVWHDGGLPPPEEAEPSGLEWDRVQMGWAGDKPPMEIVYEGDLQPGWQTRIDHWLARASEFLEVKFEPMRVAVTEESTVVPGGVPMAASSGGLILRPQLLKLPDPVRELTLAQTLQEGLAQVAVMRLGIASTSFGTTLIAVGGSWSVYRAFYAAGGPFEDGDLRLNYVRPDDLNGVGMMFGAALAGSPAALQAWTDLAEEEGPAQVLKVLLLEWRQIDRFPELLEGIEAVAEEFKRLSGD